MTASAWATLPDVPERTFADLGPDEVARLAQGLRPLPWIDGLLTAAIIAPQGAEDWDEHIWADGMPDNLTVGEATMLQALVDDQFMHVCNTLFDDPEAYRPFLGDRSDQTEAAAQWAAGFRFGIRLLPEPWAPLIDGDDTRLLLAYIFCLERDEDLPEDERATSPFREISAAAREDMRRKAVGALADLIPSLNQASVDIDTAGVENESDDWHQPYVRATPKIGRNEPCPCGSGKKHKKCCLLADADLA